MKRISSLVTALALTFVATLAPSGAALGAGVDPSGKYDAIKPPQPTETPGKVEVLEVFSYACPHCFTFLPVMEHYEKTKPESSSWPRWNDIVEAGTPARLASRPAVSPSGPRTINSRNTRRRSS